MEETRKILIVTDDEASSRSLAQGIAAAVAAPEFEGYSASVMKADTFYGTDMLPAHAFFLGCATPSPASFSYVEILFDRINLAGRPCGVFATGSKALRYLSELVAASEAVVGKPLLAKNGAVDAEKLREWCAGVLRGGKKR